MIKESASSIDILHRKGAEEFLNQLGVQRINVGAQRIEKQIKGEPR